MKVGGEFEVGVSGVVISDPEAATDLGLFHVVSCQEFHDVYCEWVGYGFWLVFMGGRGGR